LWGCFFGLRCALYPIFRIQWDNHLKLRRSNCGRPKNLLNEAVEYFYDKCKKDGNDEILQKGKIQDFLAALKKEHQKEIIFLDDRISEIKKVYGRWRITTVEQYNSNDKLLKGSKSYDQTDISKILSRLRKEKPINS
jgi:hypothetical protein